MAGGHLLLDRIKFDNTIWIVTGNKDEFFCFEKDPLKVQKPFFEQVTNETPFSFEYDDDKDDYTTRNKKKLAALLKYHHQVITEGFLNPNGGSAMIFEFKDSVEQNAKEYKALAMLRSAMNKVWDMSYQDKINTVYYYGSNPVSQTGKIMTHREVTIKLLEIGVGVVVNSMTYSTSGMSFIEHFVEKYNVSDPSYVIKTTILKALSIGLLKREGTAIMLQDRVLGSTIEEVIAWYNNNEEKKQYLIREVSKKDILDVDDVDKAVAASSEKHLEKELDDDQARKKARKLGIIHAATAKIENVRKWMKDAEVTWEQADKLGIHPAEGTSIDKVKEMIKEKEVAV